MPHGTLYLHRNTECFYVTIHSPDGYLYEKQAILEYILHQKTENARKMKVSTKCVRLFNTVLSIVTLK